MLSLWVVGLIYTGLLHFQLGYCEEIIHGEEVKPHSLPHMALLLKYGKPVCGGTLIASKWVLTAAHCEGITAVWLGVHSINSKERSRQIRAVSKTYPHPSYNGHVRNGNDIMLLELKEDVKETHTVKYLNVLNTFSKYPEQGSRCLVAGWGDFDNRIRKMSDVLLSAIVTVIDRKTCNLSQYYNKIITRKMICAGSDGTHSTDTCQGDSGGPLQCNGILVGITSFGEGCGVINKPGVYTFLTKDYIEWIKTVI